ncbi:MAG TPA: type II toxin-antitoxin system HicB family antitoxin [Allosphingosinicella sp.]
MQSAIRSAASRYNRRVQFEHRGMTDPHYHINLFWSDEDACWIADVPDLRYCSAHGDTPNEALQSVQEAMQGWLEVARDHGLTIPEPTYRPDPCADKRAA